MAVQVTGGSEDYRLGLSLRVCPVEIQGRGACPMDLQAGDLFRSDRQIGAVSRWAAHTLTTWSMALSFGSGVPWASKLGLACAGSSDLDNVPVFEVRPEPIPPLSPGVRGRKETGMRRKLETYV